MKRNKNASNEENFLTNIQGRHIRRGAMAYNTTGNRLKTCIALLAIATSFLTCLTFGKYKETLATSDTARTARYFLNLTGTETSITEFIPKTTRSFKFCVSNFEGNIDNPSVKNEVLLKYYIKIELPETNKLPLYYKLYYMENGTDKEITLNDGKTDWFFVSTVNQIDNYRLDIIWDNEKDEYTYQNLTDDIKISVELEQVDEL